MRSRVTAWVVLALTLAAAGCGSRARRPETTPPPLPAATGTLRVQTDAGIRALTVEEYVAGCIVGELGAPAASPDAARRLRAVQAILCRSYAVASRGRHAAAGFDVCGTTHCQVYRPVPGNEAGRLARAAAEETRGQVLTFDGQVIQPVYHANCGGSTSPADDVWAGPPVAWLGRVQEDACERGPGWTFKVELAALGRALASESRFALRLPLRDVAIERRDSGGRAALLRLTGGNAVIVRGDQFRAVLARVFGAQSLASTRFTLRRSGRTLIFHGHGFGHGVGLCQAGALRLAVRGQSPEAILRHYFPGTQLSQGID